MMVKVGDEEEEWELDKLRAVMLTKSWSQEGEEPSSSESNNNFINIVPMRLRRMQNIRERDFSV